MDDVTRLGRCPQCGAVLADDATDDLCPACLLGLGVADDHTHLQTDDVTRLGAEAPTMLGGGSASRGSGGVRAQLEPGQTFGPYRIERLLGRAVIDADA